jgi:hypothetical protein
MTYLPTYLPTYHAAALRNLSVFHRLSLLPLTETISACRRTGHWGVLFPSPRYSNFRSSLLCLLCGAWCPSATFTLYIFISVYTGYFCFYFFSIFMSLNNLSIYAIRIPMYWALVSSRVKTAVADLTVVRSNSFSSWRVVSSHSSATQVMS